MKEIENPYLEIIAENINDLSVFHNSTDEVLKKISSVNLNSPFCKACGQESQMINQCEIENVNLEHCTAKMLVPYRTCNYCGCELYGVQEEKIVMAQKHFIESKCN